MSKSGQLLKKGKQLKLIFEKTSHLVLKLVVHDQQSTHAIDKLNAIK